MDVYGYRAYRCDIDVWQYQLHIGTTVFVGNMHIIDGIGPTWIDAVTYKGYKGYDYNLYVTFHDIFFITYVWHIVDYLTGVNDHERGGNPYNSWALEIHDYKLFRRTRYEAYESTLPENDIHIQVYDRKANIWLSR